MNKPTVSFISPGAYSPWLGREMPTEEDKAEAERIVAEGCEHYCPVKRAARVESMARIVMQSRLDRAAVDQSRMRVA